MVVEEEADHQYNLIYPIPFIHISFVACIPITDNVSQISSKFLGSQRNYTTPIMNVIQQSPLSRSLMSSPDPPLLYLFRSVSISPVSFAILSKMPDEEIYYMFSRRIPCLQESEPTLIDLPYPADVSLNRIATTRSAARLSSLPRCAQLDRSAGDGSAKSAPAYLRYTFASRTHSSK